MKFVGPISSSIIRGYSDPRLKEAKRERNRRLLERERADHPNDPFVLFNLGWLHLQAGRPSEALELAALRSLSADLCIRMKIIASGMFTQVAGGGVNALLGRAQGLSDGAVELGQGAAG